MGLIILRYVKIKYPLLKKELFSAIQFIFHISILTLPAVWLVHYFILSTFGGTGLYFRAYGKVAFVYLILALSISPILTFVKNKTVSNSLILLRKVVGILSFIFFMKHGLEYFSMEYLFAIKHTPNIGYRTYVRQNLIIRYDALSGIVAGILMFILGITSNTFSIKILSGNVWKKIQSLVYPAFLIACIHVAFASRFDSFYIILTLWLIGVRTLSYIVQQDTPQTGATTKYICVPCGYIYDETIGDPDGGLKPGTKFTDIPDDRVCPVCGVTKKSFEPYYDAQNAIFEGYLSKVVGYTMLTKDVLELILKTDTQLTILPGQYVLVTLRDFDGEFTRAYSIVEHTGDTVKLGIKMQETGRGGRTLKNIKIGDIIKIKGVYGNFILKNTPNQKIFIATGTGISPLYNMITHNIFSKNNILFWGVQKKEDLFYINQLTSFKNLKLEIFLSKEDIKGCTYGRINISTYKFPLDTEFYLCGNASMVEEQTIFLKEKGYKNVYVEIF